jgi:hypothetical protein
MRSVKKDNIEKKYKKLKEKLRISMAECASEKSKF